MCIPPHDRTCPGGGLCPVTESHIPPVVRSVCDVSKNTHKPSSHRRYTTLSETVYGLSRLKLVPFWLVGSTLEMHFTIKPSCVLALWSQWLQFHGLISRLSRTIIAIGARHVTNKARTHRTTCHTGSCVSAVTMPKQSICRHCWSYVHCGV